MTIGMICVENKYDYPLKKKKKLFKGASYLLIKLSIPSVS